MNKKILITGSQGYIGSHLIQMISDRYDIYKLDLRDPTNPLDIRSDFSFDIEFVFLFTCFPSLIDCGLEEQATHVGIDYVPEHLPLVGQFVTRQVVAM